MNILLNIVLLRSTELMTHYIVLQEVLMTTLFEPTKCKASDVIMVFIFSIIIDKKIDIIFAPLFDHFENLNSDVDSIYDLIGHQTF